ncbi:hypothetical protein BX600DRAFT_493030 [Xylariales sp. PMI_506]|nr:hypothetical protein BX600DRAFT_493030 [Xylariales sp. PMI_506]
MAPGQKLYPRATVKKIVKANSRCNVSKNADVLIFLDYVLFMQTLVKEAAIDSKQAGERGISAKSVKKVTAPSSRDERRWSTNIINPTDNTIFHMPYGLGVQQRRETAFAGSQARGF